MSPDNIKRARAMLNQREKALFRIVELRDEIEEQKALAASLTMDRIAKQMQVSRDALSKALKRGAS